MNSIQEAQKDMRQAYFYGVPGIICSGLVWVVAAIVAFLSTPFTGILALVFGGMAIFPASVLLCKLLGYSGRHDSNNPLGALAIEGTVWMLLLIPIAVVLATFSHVYFFPAMLLVIAGRYLTFTTLYGLKVYYAFGATLAASAIVFFMLRPPVFVGALTGGVIELAFALLILFGEKR